MEIVQLGLVAIKAEANYGVDPVPTKAANLIPLVAGSFNYQVDSTPEERAVQDGTLDRIIGFNTLPNATVKFQYQLRGNISPLANYAAQAVTCEADDDKITLAAHTLRNGDMVMFTGVAMPAGLTASAYYYVVAADANTFQVSETLGGAAVNFTTDGTTVVMTSKRYSIADGVAARAHELDAILQAANLKATYTAATLCGAQDGYVTYTPEGKTTEGPSVTVYWWSALKLHKLVGGKVDIAFAGDVGKMGLLDITIRGKYEAVTDVAFDTSGATWVDTKPPLFLPTTLSLGSYTAPVATRLNWRLGNQIAQRNDLLATDGVKGFLITDYVPAGDLNPESVTEATNPFWADWKASTQKTLTVVNGSAAGNKYTFTFGTELKSVNYSDANRTRIHNAQFNIVKSLISSTAGAHFALKLH